MKCKISIGTLKQTILTDIGQTDNKTDESSQGQFLRKTHTHPKTCRRHKGLAVYSSGSSSSSSSGSSSSSSRISTSNERSDNGRVMGLLCWRPRSWAWSFVPWGSVRRSFGNRVGSVLDRFLDGILKNELGGLSKILYMWTWKCISHGFWRGEILFWK